ncbi:GNAT family N-acetyltransferase [Mariniluteicoccus endophyticus]
MNIEVSRARPADLPFATAYALLRLRTDVFVVEQECAYPELDGRDLEPDCVWFWAHEGDDVLATLRLLTDAGGVRRIGRVATSGAARGRGVAARLMEAALAEWGDAPVVLDAQAHLEHWYARFGFAVSGSGFVEDGIPHVPMRRG